MSYVSPHSRDKHWEFFASEHDVALAVTPVVAAAFTGNDAARNEQRVEMLGRFVQTQIWCGAVDLHHDPGAGEDPQIVRDDLASRLRSLLDGEHDAYERVAAQPLFNDDFADPAWVTRLVEALVDAIATGVDDQTIEVTAAEPYDSCRACGGYHNVNWDCS